MCSTPDPGRGKINMNTWSVFTHNNRLLFYAVFFTGAKDLKTQVIKRIPVTNNLRYIKTLDIH